ncbi:MAG: ABC transporter substrate-binding protein [Chloroflexi bacterium]|nr:ABC transporter substrate-binding protein [Chloroflexota bacterium]MBI2983795.1 ABC transporter substrate-binding protein [Chloroflexota bacterium]
MKLLAVLTILVAACTPAPAEPAQRTTLEIAYADDPSRHALLWGIVNGKVTSPTVDVKVSFLPLAQIIPAANTKQYDALEATPLALPRAPGAEPGFLILSNGLVNISSTALMVGKDGVRSPAELKGKTIGVASLGGTFVLETRYVLQKQHGLNTDLRTGEVKFSETPPEATATLLRDGKLDAAVLAQLAFYRLRGSADHRTLVNVTEEFTRLSGHRPVNSVIVTYRDKAEAKRAALGELQRMLASSRAYLMANKAEVFKDVAQKRGVDEAFLEWVFTVLDLAAGPLTDTDMAQIATTWEAAKSIGDIQSAPAVKDVTFRP